MPNPSSTERTSHEAGSAVNGEQTTLTSQTTLDGQTAAKGQATPNDQTALLEKRNAQAAQRLKTRRRVVVGVLAVLLVSLALVSFTVGSYSMTLPELWATVRAVVTGALDTTSSRNVAVLFSIRIPRVLLAACVGAALAASGAAYQGIFRNPMVSPDILGVSNAASVGVALGLLLGLPTLAVHAMSFAFGIGAVVLVLAIAHAVTRKQGDAILVMILSGVVMGSLGQALLSLIKYVADPNDVLPAITYWLMGSFARSGNATNVLIMAGILAVGAGILIALRWQLNTLTFGEEEARSLGVNVRRMRLLVIAASTLMTSASVCLCGVVGWVGLIIPHVVRLALGPDYRSLIPTSLLTGACFMLAVDDVARVIVPGELPVGVLTSLIGAPLFVFMLVRSQRAHN